MTQTKQPETQTAQPAGSEPKDPDPADKTKGMNEKVAKVMEPLAKFAPHAAAVAIIAWLCCLATLFVYIKEADEVLWGRLIIVFGSIQAVAFAAFGALFGTTVQLQRVATAEKQADEAKEETQETRKAAKQQVGDANKFAKDNLAGIINLAGQNREDALFNRDEAVKRAHTSDLGIRIASAVKAEAAQANIAKGKGFIDADILMDESRESLRLAKLLLPDPP